jgi:SAM-dependent methyltransferase
MKAAFSHEPGFGLADEDLPGYWRMLHAYHCSRSAELRAIIATLPIAPGARALDVASGDGCYSIWLAERGAQVTSLDLSPAYLDYARGRVAAALGDDAIIFEQGDASALPFADESFDLTWCAQSFYSLPDPLAALHEMIRVTRPGGIVAVLENDTLHHILLPWPAELELAVRQAQLQALGVDHAGPGIDKFYIGRNLCGLFRQCDLETCDIQMFPVERDAPLSDDEETFLRLYFADLRERAWPYLELAARTAFDMLFDPAVETYLLRQPDLHVTHLESLAVGRKAAS